MSIKISIITVCFNSEKTISHTIESVLNQTYDDIEYIIVDGSSTDSTMDIVREYEPGFNGRMRYISEPDGGIYFAMNKGISMASGELIGLINSDDWYEYDAVERIVHTYVSAGKNRLSVIHGQTYAYNGSSMTAVTTLSPNELKTKGMGSHPSCFVTKETYNMLGGFNEEYRYVSDYDFMLRAYESGISFYEVDEHIANAQLNGLSASANAYEELLKLQYRYKIIPLHSYILKTIKSELAKRMVKHGLKPIQISKKYE